jgi:hypothetical protein
VNIFPNSLGWKNGLGEFQNICKHRCLKILSPISKEPNFCLRYKIVLHGEIFFTNLELLKPHQESGSSGSIKTFPVVKMSREGALWIGAVKSETQRFRC